MAHCTTQKEFKELRDQLFTIVTFKDNNRICTTSGMPLPRLLKEIQLANVSRLEYVIFTDQEIKERGLGLCTSWDKTFYY